MVEVFGRDTELDALRHFLDVTSEGPCALMLEGEAGIGKTTLWSLGVEYGRERAFRVLPCRSARSEAELSYAGLADVLGGISDEALETLPDVQRHALEVALLRAEPGEVPVDHRTVAAGTVGALRWFASASPVLIALDDPQWMDAASLRALAYAVRRLDDERVGVLTAVRTGEGQEDPLELQLAFPDERLRRIEVGPLSAEDLGRMLDQRLGWVPQGSALFELHTVSGGNPLFALEIARAMLLDPDHGFLVPRSLHEQVSDRIVALPRGTREALVVAAALPRATVGMIEGAIERDGDVLRPAVEAGMVEVYGSSVRFTHPLYASVAYAEAGEDARAQVHRRVADMVRDPEERARHLALSTAPPDAVVADALEEAADRARSRGAQMVAAELNLEARRYTPEDREDDGRRRAVLAADDLYLEGDHLRVRSLLEEVLAESPMGRERAGVLWRLGRLAWQGDVLGVASTDAWLDRAEDEAGDDPALLSQIHRERFFLTWQRFRYGELPGHARLALRMAERAEDLRAVAASLAMAVIAGVVVGRGVDDDLVGRATTAWAEAELAPRGSVAASEEHPALLCGIGLLWTDRLDEARSMFELLGTQSRERGSGVGLCWALFWLAEVELRAGNWDLAVRHLDEAVQLGVNDVAIQGRGTVLAHLGSVDGARRDLVEGSADAESQGWIDSLQDTLGSLGFLELSLGNFREAHGYLSRAMALFEAAGIREPSVCLFLADAIETLVGLGELAEAERLTDWLEERGRALDRVWALAVGARCRGLVFAGKGEYEAALEHLQRAMVEHERLPMPFERGRTLLALGTIRRRAKKKRAAREALEEALEIFERLGAKLWEKKARAELSAVGGRPRATGELTPTEERVALLAAAGRTNREIAETLYLSVRTVETHLSRAYHKLGVRSRTELAFALDTERPM